MARRSPKGLRGVAGFTILELLTVVVVSTMGFVALFGMQTATIRGMANTRHIVQATTLAENFIEQLRLEFMLWTTRPADSLSNTTTFPHLAGLPTGLAAAPGNQTPGDGIPNAQGWVIGDTQGGDDRRVSVVGDPHDFGWTDGIRQAMLSPGFEGVEQPYCLHYRLTWLLPRRAIRAEVEVSWPLETADMDAFVDCNQLAANNLGELRSITLTSTLAVNTFQR
ncbi:MAG: type IV pilus modification PilV family protein [Myxococcota bacterium]